MVNHSSDILCLTDVPLRTTSTAALGDIDPILAQHVEFELGLTKRNGTTTSGTRKNAWGNLSYAELITKAIMTSAEQRLTLSEIYDWMIKYVPFFRHKIDRTSSAGWKNSIRHNLSLHNRFKRIQSESTGKSSWWIINPDDQHSSIVRHAAKMGRRRSRPINKSTSTPSINTSKRKSNRSSIPVYDSNSINEISYYPLNSSSTDISYNQFSQHPHTPNYTHHYYSSSSSMTHEPTTNTNTVPTYAMQTQQQVSIDLNDDQHIFLRTHSRSSESSTSSCLSPSNYSYPQKNSPWIDDPMTLYSHHYHHHHHHFHHHHHHPNLEPMFHSNETDDDEYDLSTLVHHHHPYEHPTTGSNVLTENHHSFHPHQDATSSSILRTVLQRSTIDYKQHEI